MVGLVWVSVFAWPSCIGHSELQIGGSFKVSGYTDCPRAHSVTSEWHFSEKGACGSCRQFKRCNSMTLF